MTETGDLATVQRLGAAFRDLKAEIGKVIVGQDDVLDQLLMAIFAKGHCLLEGVPGLAKTLMVSTLSKTMTLSFKRVQFTPDLMPSDITGTEVIQEDKATGNRSFKFVEGPVFANVVLADEINRTPPKTQAALLEAMQERQVTVGGKRHDLPDPFFVLATQNPIEQEGTYSLPEAQLDRFMFLVKVGYPNADEELRIVQSTTSVAGAPPKPLLSADDIRTLQDMVRRVPVSDHVVKYAVEFARRTRKDGPDAPDFVKQNVEWGAGPRASQYLVLAAKAHAVLHGRTYVSGADIRAVAKPVLRHRILLSYGAQAQKRDSDWIIDQLLETIPRAEADRAVG